MKLEHLKIETRLITLYSCRSMFVFVYYESIKRQVNRRLMCECRGDERLKIKATDSEGSTRLGYTGLLGELEHLKIETRLIDERFESVMGECLFLT